MLLVRESQQRELGDAAPNQPVIQACTDNPHWIEFQLLDKENNPVPGEPFRIRMPDQSLVTGTLNNQGKARFECLVQGQATICFTGMDATEWWPL